ncbi:uncharacterized protein [Syngnathus scovelli]|uniref:uncharacterized protein n=1 Tax=Syngnathus scovelli TaxID=161590 RepID=UPI0021104C3C|nr:uncharacterized protein LOC125978881 [Syngnathus scovelli]
MVHWQQVASSNPPQESRIHQTGQSIRTTCQNWALPSIDKVAKACLHGGVQFLPGNDGVCGCRSKKTTKQDAASQLTSSDSFPHRFRHQRSGTQEGRKFQPQGPRNGSCRLHGDPAHSSKLPSISRHLKPVLQKHPHELLTSQMPLGLQIKVSGQRDGLGISIAGGKGSLPYKDHDEGIFISRVTKGGPSEKAGLHVGDRLLEVNNLSMQGATHLEAVRALRNAGSCINMKVLREGSQVRGQVTNNTCDAVSQRPCSHNDAKSHRSTLQEAEDTEDCLPKKMDVVVCNGNGISDLRRSQLEAEALTERNDLHSDKNTMKIPRIILTHPSTSDEDVDLLPQALSKEEQHDAGISENSVPLQYFDSAFYPP